ncbi:Cadherin-86C [Eumeta japonica]|uniref:Cadherin-86C n=1 Tax=Eumeta variegata TaxID=151549 RepID=A0A4C2A635_EUMVA|nr:Cadherin-86C [Eumeta japonica]
MQYTGCWGSPLFAIRQRRVSTENTEGTIFLVGPLDFEAQSMYHLTLLAVTDIALTGFNTRNFSAAKHHSNVPNNSTQSTALIFVTFDIGHWRHNNSSSML